MTQEDYLGVGSFFVMLPSYLRTLLRWTEHTPLWALTAPPARRPDLVNRITQRVTRKVATLSRASARERAYWGLEHLLTAAQA